MNKIRSVKFNFLMNFILTASSFIFPLITFPYISRILMAEGVGRVAFTTSIASYFTMIATLGIPTYGIRACARVRDDKEKLSKVAQELLIIHTFTTIIAVILFLISIFSVNTFYQERQLLIINAASMILNVIGMDWLYRALEQYEYITLRSLFFKIVSIVMMFLFVHKETDYIVYGAISIFASIGSNILNFWNIRKFISFKKRNNYNILIHIGPIFVFFAQTVAVTVYTNLDTVMLGFMCGNKEVGYYNAAIKVKSILLSLVTSLGAVLLPRLSYYIKENKVNEFRNIVTKAFEFIVLLSLPLSVYFIIFAQDGLVFLSGDAFESAELAMQIITPTIFFIGLSNLFGIQVLTPMGKEKLVLISVIIGAIVDLIFNIIFIPVLGAAGAALGTLIAEIVVLIVQIYFCKELFFAIVKKSDLWKIFFSLIISTSFILTVSYFLRASLLIKLVITSILFFGLYVCSLIVIKEKVVYDLYSRLKSKLIRSM